MIISLAGTYRPFLPARPVAPPPGSAGLLGWVSLLEYVIILLSEYSDDGTICIYKARLYCSDIYHIF